VTPIDSRRALEALCQHLHDKGLARYSLTDAPVEEMGRPWVVWGELPDQPDTAVAVVQYDDDRSRDTHNPDFYFQLRFRAAGQDLRLVNSLADVVFAELHWTDDHDPEVWSGGVHVLHSTRVVRAVSPPDANGRYERFDSYRITFNPGD
jgi:hypothetical protein